MFISFDVILLPAVAMFRRLMCAFSLVAFISALSRLTVSPEFSLKAIFLMYRSNESFVIARKAMFVCKFFISMCDGSNPSFFSSESIL